MRDWDLYLIQLVNFLTESPHVILPFAFLFGSMVGSLLNVCILRMPRGKSLWWPPSRCGSCFQAIPGKLNVPLLSYVRLHGRCQVCGVRYSSRYFWIEFLTASVFGVLFWLEVGLDVRGVGLYSSAWRYAAYDHRLVLIWGYHAVLVSCLLAAVFIDLAHKSIPRSLLVFGVLVGVVGGTLGASPWPVTASSTGGRATLAVGLQTLPLWTRLPSWLGPGSFQLGLATVLTGILAGWILYGLLGRIVPRMMPTKGGDWLLMMIGAFSGWQVLCLAIVLGILLANCCRLMIRDRPLRFSPFLAVGTMLSLVVFGRVWVALADRVPFP